MKISELIKSHGSFFGDEYIEEAPVGMYLIHDLPYFLDKYPDFFDSVNLQIADKDIYSGFSIKAPEYYTMPIDIKLTFTGVKDTSKFSFNLEDSLV